MRIDPALNVGLAPTPRSVLMPVHHALPVLTLSKDLLLAATHPLLALRGQCQQVLPLALRVDLVPMHTSEPRLVSNAIQDFTTTIKEDLSVPPFVTHARQVNENHSK